MATTTTLRKTGGSLYVTIPAKIAGLVGEVGDEFEVSLDGGNLVLKPITASLDDLLDGVTPKTFSTEEDKTWESMALRGKEQ